jgi:RimK family alpha-L-glutamate ligase
VHIGLAIDETDWHARALRKAGAERDMAITSFRLADAGFDTTARHGLLLPGFTDRLPDGVFIRAVAGGSFEEVTRRLGILHALRELGVPVWNEARAIERCVDKSTASFLLAQAGIATPPTWTVEGRDAAFAVAERACAEGGLVLKPLFGSQGRGLQRIIAASELPPPEVVGGVYYLQRFIRSGRSRYRDHRLFVCGDRCIAAMTREAERWVTNIRLGATPLPFHADAELTDLAVRAARATGCAYAGVDLLRDEDGRPWVLEVNSMPGWRGLQQVIDVSIADELISALRMAITHGAADACR